MVVKASTKPWPRQLGSSILRALPPRSQVRSSQVGPVASSTSGVSRHASPPSFRREALSGRPRWGSTNSPAVRHVGPGHAESRQGGGRIWTALLRTASDRRYVVGRYPTYSAPGFRAGRAARRCRCHGLDGGARLSKHRRIVDTEWWKREGRGSVRPT